MCSSSFEARQASPPSPPPNQELEILKNGKTNQMTIEEEEEQEKNLC